MFPFFNFGVQELTIVLVFGGLVVVPLIVGIVALSLTHRSDRGMLAQRTSHRGGG